MRIVLTSGTGAAVESRYGSAKSGISPDAPVATPLWARAFLEAETWQGQRFSVTTLARMGSELLAHLDDSADPALWAFDEDEIEVDLTVVFAMLARDLGDCGEDSYLGLGTG